MLDSMTAAEFREWQRYDRIEPLHRLDFMLGQIAAMLSTSESSTPEKFMPFVDFEDGDDKDVISTADELDKII